MSFQEVGWRVHESLRGLTDRALLRRRQRPWTMQALLEPGVPTLPGFAVADVEPGQWATAPANAEEALWATRLAERGDHLAAGRLTFFDLENCPLGTPIDWNRDPKAGQAAPRTFAGAIDYRDHRRVGDCKFVWEPNRHHHLVVLGRAYRATGDIRYARAAVAQLTSWLHQCPYGIGMAWRSPLELGVRLINWVWMLDLIAPAPLIDETLRHLILNTVRRQMWEIDRKYSRGSSSNNHLIGEAAGVYVAASYFPFLQDAEAYRLRSRERLCREILQQTWPDGGSREQATGYELFALQFFLVAGLVGRWTGEEFPPEYWQRLERMCEFLALLAEGGQQPPMIGDADDGYVLDLGEDPGDLREWLAVAAALFDRPDFRNAAGGVGETARWLLGQQSLPHLAGMSGHEQPPVLTSRAVPHSGYYLLQAGQGAESISAVFDCGPLGMGPLAAHGHADALSFVLRAYGVDVLVDPGTYDYFSYPRWRRYFRSTRAHNTVVIDGADQSEMLGPFLWGRRAQASCLEWLPSEIGGKVIAEHDGYTHLRDPVLHRRTLQLDGPERTLVCVDQILTRGRHEVSLQFHLAEQCSVRSTGPHSFEVDAGPGTVSVELDPHLSVRTVCGQDEPIGGWVSRGYHRKMPSHTIVGHCVCEGSLALVCRIHIGPPRAGTPDGVAGEAPAIESPV